MKLRRRIGSFLLALVMTLSVLSPNLALAEGDSSANETEVPYEIEEIDGALYRVFNLDQAGIDFSEYVVDDIPQTKMFRAASMPFSVGEKTPYYVKIAWNTYDVKPTDMNFQVDLTYKIDGVNTIIASTNPEKDPVQTKGKLEWDQVPNYHFYKTEKWDDSFDKSRIWMSIREEAELDVTLKVAPGGASVNGPLTINVAQKAMTLYSSKWSTRNPDNNPEVRGYWYNTFNNEKKIFPMPKDNHQYYSMMEAANGTYYKTKPTNVKKREEDAVVELSEYIADALRVSSENGANNVRLLIKKPGTKEKERVGNFTHDNTSYHFYVTGNYKTPFVANFREDLKVTFNTADNGADQDAKVNTLVKEGSRKREDSVVLHGLSIKGTDELKNLKDAPLTVDGVKMPDNPEPANPKHTFLGWSTKYMAKPVTSADQFLEADKFTEDTIVTDNITVYPVFSAKLEDKDKYLPEYDGLEVKAGEVIPSGDKKLSASLYVKELDGTKGAKVAEEQVSGKLYEDDQFKIKDSYDGKDNFATDPTIDDKGGISFTVKSRDDADFKQRLASGDIEVSIPVLVKYKDGSTEEVQASVTIKQEETDMYASKLEAKNIVVWKDTPTDKIMWVDGVKAKENIVDGDDVVNAINRVEEATTKARETGEAGTFTGKLKVTFQDGSDCIIENQNLVVTEEIIKDSNADAPKDAISVTFKKGDGVKTIDGETIDITWRIKPNHEIKVGEFPVVDVDEDNDYDKDNKKWLDKKGKEDHRVTNENNEFTAVAYKLSDKDIIPFLPTDPEPTTDSSGAKINRKDYVRVEVKVAPDTSKDPENTSILSFNITGYEKKSGPAMYALVRTNTKWETVKNAVDKNRAIPGYAFWYWYTKDSEKADQDPDTSTVKENEVKTAYFIKDGQELTGKKKAIPLPTGWYKVTVTKDDATIEDNASYGKTYAVAPKDDAKGTTGMLAQDKFPTITVKTVANKELSEGAWYDVADVEKEVKDPWTIEVEKDTTFKAKAEEMVTINYARNPEKAEDGTDIARLTRDDEKVKLSGEPKGSKVELKNNDYKFVNWTNEANQEVSKALEYKPSSNVKQTYTANFVKKADVMITYKVNDEEAGTVNDKLKDTESLAPSTGNAKGATAKAKPGYEFVNWTNEAGKQVSVAEKFVPEKKNGLNVEATYTANFKQLISAQPSIQPVTEGDKDITVIVEGNPKGTLEVTIPGVKNPIPATKQKDGSYKVTVPEEITLKSGDEIVATFTEENKKPSTDRVTVKGKTSTPITPPKSDKTVERVDGDDRVDTSIEVSKKYFRQAETVIVARKDLYPDALSAAVLSRLLKAPILLTATNELDERVAQEIKRLGASQVIIAGGYSAISKYTERELSQFDKDRVERLGGLDRYETSAIVAERVLGITGGSSHRAVVATGEDFPDALTSGAFAAKEAYPILLVRSSGVPETINKVIRDNKINEVYVIGGETRIPSKVVSQLPKMIARLAGSDRYETSVAVAKYAFGNSYKAYIASGEVFPDTLVIAPVAARDFAPILLTTKNELPESVKSYIDSSNFSHFVIVGGPARISKAIEESLAK